MRKCFSWTYLQSCKMFILKMHLQNVAWFHLLLKRFQHPLVAVTACLLFISLGAWSTSLRLEKDYEPRVGRKSRAVERVSLIFRYFTKVILVFPLSKLPKPTHTWESGCKSFSTMSKSYVLYKGPPSHSFCVTRTWYHLGWKNIASEHICRQQLCFLQNTLGKTN